MGFQLVIRLALDDGAGGRLRQCRRAMQETRVAVQP
jgi:hypothetical protein